MRNPWLLKHSTCAYNTIGRASVAQFFPVGGPPLHSDEFVFQDDAAEHVVPRDDRLKQDADEFATITSIDWCTLKRAGYVEVRRGEFRRRPGMRSRARQQQLALLPRASGVSRKTHLLLSIQGALDPRTTSWAVASWGLQRRRWARKSAGSSPSVRLLNRPDRLSIPVPRLTDVPA